jgi:two-component system, OmpR family, response regulator
MGSPDRGSTPRILCVDDNQDLADTTACLLQLFGFDARACYDGPSALIEVANFYPGVCLIDLQMPGMDGDELAMRLRASDNFDTPILIAMTAMSNDSACKRITAAGFDMHLIKPVPPKRLVAAIGSLWQKSLSVSMNRAMSESR